MKVLALVLAYLTIRLGYALLVSGAKGEFKFSGGFGGARADLASASPGLLFVLLAIALAIFGISVTKVTTFEASGVPQQQSAPQVKMPPPPQPPFKANEAGQPKSAPPVKMPPAPK